MRSQIQSYLVTAHEMQQIESRVLAAGMPVEALMEKVAGRIARWVQDQYPLATYPQVGVLVGPGHNGGDALVVARELQFHGYSVRIYSPFPKLKPLTQAHADYARSLGIPFTTSEAEVATCDLLIDGLFGFGLERIMTEELAAAVDRLNQAQRPIVSIDLPSGLHTDTGATLGAAIQATHTLCLGLWKRAFVQDWALAAIGQPHLIDFDLPLADIQAVVGESPKVSRLTPDRALMGIPLPRPANTHKYAVGHLLLVCGSAVYPGAALLAGLGARASGAGMVTMVVPEALRLWLVGQLPEVLVRGCGETATGAIANLPDDLDLGRYNAIAVGPGLSRDAQAVLPPLLNASVPLVVDADGLNLLALDLSAQSHPAQTLAGRSAPTVLTPHPGEFSRLFPDLVVKDAVEGLDAGIKAQRAAEQSQSLVVLKGARVAIAHPDGRLWFNPHSTPGLARGGSGDVLTGLMGGLIAQQATPTGVLNAALAAVWLHAQAGIQAAHTQTELGVDPVTLSRQLLPTLQAIRSNPC